MDIQSEGKKDVTLDTLVWIHEHKTAALLEFAIVGGASSAAPPTRRSSASPSSP